MRRCRRSNRPGKLSGARTILTTELWRDPGPDPGRRRDNDLRRKDRGGIGTGGSSALVRCRVGGPAEIKGRAAMADLERTVLHGLHLSLGAKMVPSAGYDMPVHYPMGVLTERLPARARAGPFAVSH